MRVRCDVRNCAVAAFVVILVGSDPITSAAATPQEPEEKGTQSVAGVTVTAEADAWRGIPAELTRVIPLLVTLENNGSSAIRLRYSEFALVDGAKRAPVLPPFQIEGTEVVGTTGVLAPYTYPLSGFHVAPYLVRFYPGLSPFDGVFVYDPFFYSSYYPRFASLQLPTTDMVQKAMPEGVLQPGAESLASCTSRTSISAT